jgi:hypothetical protein
MLFKYVIDVKLHHNLISLVTAFGLSITLDVATGILRACEIIDRLD